MKVSKSLSQPDSQDQTTDWTWFSFALGVLLLPLFPALGLVGLLLAMYSSGQKNLSKILADRLNQLLAVLSLLMIASSALAAQPREAWLGLANFLPFFLLFVTLKNLIRRPEQLRQISWLLICPSLLIVGLGLGQLYGSWSTPPLVKSILGWELIARGVPAGRMSAVFIYTNFLAIYLAIAFTLTLGLWFDTWRQLSNTSRQNKNVQDKSVQSKNSQNSTNYSKSSQNKWVLLCLTLILAADISGLILTSSRNAWGLAIFSFMSYAIYLGWRWLTYSVSGGAIAILWASFAPSWGGTQLRKIVPSFFWARLSDQMYERPIETLRITQWQFCWDLIKQRPLFGWGLRNFTPLYEAQLNFWFGHPHSLFLMLGAETGAIALLLLLVIVGTIMIQGVELLQTWSNDDSQLIFFSYLVAFSCCTLFNLLDVTIFDLRVNTIGWLLLVAISGIVTEQRKLS